MGYMRHHAILVTSWNDALIEKAQAVAISIFSCVSSLIDSSTNHYKSFFIPPDGSKEGWKESDEGDKRRKEFINWIDQQRYEDGSSALNWVEIQYGDDNNDTIIVNYDSQNRKEIP